MFEALFEQVTCEALSGRRLEPIRESDGELSGAEITLALFDSLQLLEPTGRGFENARFDGEFEILNVREIGDGTHVRLSLKRDGIRLPAVWFRARRKPTDPLPVHTGERAHFLYSLAEDEYQGRRRLDVRIEARVRSPTGTATNLSQRPLATSPRHYRPSALRAKRRPLWGAAVR